MSDKEQRIEWIKSEMKRYEYGDNFLFTNRNGNLPKYEALRDELRSLTEPAQPRNVDAEVHEHIMGIFGFPKRELVNPQTIKDMGGEI